MAEKSDRDSVTLLIVEDNDGHARLIQECLKDSGWRDPAPRFSDGLEVWEYLRGHGPSGLRLAILLDLRMPRMDGLELLRLMKGDPRLCQIPVIILSTSEDLREEASCRSYGCISYLTKPVDFEQFKGTIRQVADLINAMEVRPVPLLR